MFQIILFIVIGILIVFGLVKIVDKFLPKKLRPVLSIVLFAIIGVLAYFNYNAIYGPVEFNKEKVERYKRVIDKLKDIREVQIAHKEVAGYYAKDFNSLLTFLDTAEYTITQRVDIKELDEEQTKAFGVDIYVDRVRVDTLRFRGVKDSLFGSSDRYKNMMEVPFTRDENGNRKIVQMDAGLLKLKNTTVPVFELKVPKDWVLHDLDPDLVIQEKQVIAVDGINGAYIRVGSMDEVSTNGNWPTTYGKSER
jgi:hypothetical protein